MVKTRVVALVSGGVDSMCSLVYWLSKGYDASVVFFDYGHKASRKELETVKGIVSELNSVAVERKWGRVIDLLVLDISFMKKLWKGTQLVDETVDIKKEYERTVVVPIRNIVMLTIATAYAYTLLEQGVCDKAIVVLGSQYSDVEPRKDTGEPMYPDCSPECFLSIESALKICHFRDRRGIEVWTPSIAMLKKSELLKMCYNTVGDLVYRTWSCYKGLEKHCGTCESCINRRKAFKEAGIPDKTEYLETLSY
ncbi:MAG: 7-cyano-7-deazaguanine synthase [Ignisphaera sp.]